MSDIGFGLIDRRTVITVLFTIVLANLLFGMEIPIDTATVGSLFIGLVILTGYLYLVRSAFRLPVALVGSIMIIVDTLTSQDETPAKQEPDEEITDQEPDEEITDQEAVEKANKKDRVRKLKWILLLPFRWIFYILFFISWFLSLIFSFGEWNASENDNPFIHLIEEKRWQYSKQHKWNDEGFKLSKYYRSANNILGVLDRLGVIAFSFLAAMPFFRAYLGVMGIIGLILMVLAFTFRGNFTGLVKDFISKEEEEKNKEKHETTTPVEVKNTSTSPLHVVIDEKPKYYDN